MSDDTVQSTTAPPPGWYAAPHAGGAQQYWNGSQWLLPTPAPAYALIQRAPTNGPALAAMIVGMFAIAIAVFVPIPLLGFFALWPSVIAAAITVILGHIGRRSAVQIGVGRGMATTGLWLGYGAITIVGATIAFWAIAALAAATHSAN